LVALKVQESDDDSTYTDIDELDFSDTAQKDIDGVALGLPSATDDNKVLLAEIDMRGRKRYLRLVATAGDGATGTYLVAFAILSRGGQGPVSSADRGCKQVARV
jgi:hypothetical protein